MATSATPSANMTTPTALFVFTDMPSEASADDDVIPDVADARYAARDSFGAFLHLRYLDEAAQLNDVVHGLDADLCCPELVDDPGPHLGRDRRGVDVFAGRLLTRYRRTTGERSEEHTSELQSL